MHYKLLAKLLRDRHPEIKMSERILRKLLKINPIFFRNMDDEVFGVEYRMEPDFDGLFDLLNNQ